MRTRICRILWIVWLVVLLASCSSTKSLKTSLSVEGMSGAELVENVMANAGGWDALSAKMTLSVDMGGKDATVTKVSGTLRIRKGQVIQMSIAPLLGIEVARVEISPEGVLVIDRMHKRYVEVPFAELKMLSNADLDFHTLQALFLNELFLPGKENLTSRDISSFKIETIADKAVLDVKRTKRFSYQFITRLPEALLTESRIGLKGTSYLLKWGYDDFRSLGHKSFPTDMQISFEGGRKPVRASFALSRLTIDTDWETHTEISRKYEKMELGDILKQLLKR